MKKYLSLIMVITTIIILTGSCNNESRQDFPEVPDREFIEDVITGNPHENSIRNGNTIQWVRTKLVPWAQETDPDYRHASDSAVEMFKDMKIGIRIHWGVYCLNGSNPSWSLWYKKGQLRSKEDYPESSGLSNEDYVEYMKRYSTFYQDFNPTGFDPEEWAGLFKSAGLKFAVLTSKHHDGFSLFHTETTVNALEKTDSNRGEPGYKKVRNHYSIMETPYKRDIVGMFSDAMRKEDIRVGFYFSNPDWNDYDFRFGQHNIYRDPAYTRESDPEGWNRALMRHRQQLTELCTNYGKIDILSLDHGLPMDAWPELKTTLKMIRDLQPDMMIRRRGIGAYGDHFTPEGKRPVFPGEQHRADELTFHRYPDSKPWSKIGGTGSHPGYDPELKEIDTKRVIHQLIEICSMGGIMQLGFGPGPDGKFHENVLVFFQELGKWLELNGEGIYSTRPCDPLSEEYGDGIYFTRSRDHKKRYVFLTKWPGESLTFRKSGPGTGIHISLAGYEKPLIWEEKEGSFIVQWPDELPAEALEKEVYAWMITIEHP